MKENYNKLENEYSIKPLKLILSKEIEDYLIEDLIQNFIN